MDEEQKRMEELEFVAGLIDQLKDADVKSRVSALNSVERIARALGPERTRNELIPFLTDIVDDEDEILLVLTKKLVDLQEFVGGPEHIHLLLPPLELLANVEEFSIRASLMEAASFLLV
jgi:serine/threonine-protein phosphatase 2A regulatory subunit A